MKALIFIPDAGSASEVFYKTEEISSLFYGAYGEMIVRARRYSDDTIIEQVTVPVPGVFVDVLVTVAPYQSNVRFYITVTRSTGGSSSTTQSGATTYSNPGYSESLSVSVVAT